MNHFILTFFFVFLLFFNTSFAQISLKGEFIFKPDKAGHGHTHASSLVECPDGSLLACWYEGKSDRSTDVHIQAARLLKGHKTWSPDFLLADTPMLSDNNPCLFVDRQKRLWLFYYTLLGSPEEAWDTAFLRYKISTQYEDASKPIIWDVQSDLPVKPNDLDETVETLCRQALAKSHSDPRVVKQCELARVKLKSQLARKLGWTTRAKPITLSSGAILLPMASEIFGIAMMAITPDGGRTWKFSKPPLGYGIEQPTVFEKKDGTLVAYFRDSSPAHRIRKSESHDLGLTWSPVVNTDFPNPGSGIEVLRLMDGNIVLIYNDCVDDPRNSLAVSMSDDEGKSWKWTRHIERTKGAGRFDYPSIIQTRDGKLHATFSYNLQTIKYVSFTEDWIKTTEKK
ncbi:MAG: neuraminidase (sialidase)-like protein [Actinobacteria bacterium]|nr:neuraminidase (sialidase)-like protein [Actinomycetota bacterium]